MKTCCQFFKDNQAAVAPLTAICLVVIMMALALAVDLIHIYVVKVELQNAADAGANAGAQALLIYSANPPLEGETDYARAGPANRWLPLPDRAFRPLACYLYQAPLRFTLVSPALAGAPELPLTLAQASEPVPVMTNCDLAKSVARQTVMLNKADGQFLTIPEEDTQMGLWSYNMAGQWDFAAVPCSNSTNAIRVVTRKTNAVNGPVPLFFGWAVGKSHVEVNAEAIALLGWVKKIPPGKGAFPMALTDNALPLPGEEKQVTFTTDWGEDGGWHSFHDPSTGASDLKKLVNRTIPSPEIKIGDLINCTNGVDAAVFQEMHKQFYQVHHGDSWILLLPVIRATDQFQQIQEVIGFAAFRVSEVKGPPDKTVTGTVISGYMAPGTESGGPDYGLRASFPKLVR
jgi:hypothetical protein